jgi:hypothetical protein
MLITEPGFKAFAERGREGYAEKPLYPPIY